MIQLFIGGAPKCGTSSLYSYLSLHPEIITSKPKETFYFMDEDHPLLNRSNNYYINGIDGFEEYFLTTERRGKVRLEATTHYLFQKSIAEKIDRLKVETKLIFVLREPATRVYSSFKYTQNNLANLSKKIPFSKYVDDQIATSSDVPDYLVNEKLFVLKNDIEYSKYCKHLDYWYEHFEESNIKLLLFEDLKENPEMALDLILDFIGVESFQFDRSRMGPKNVTVRIKNQKLHGLAIAFNKYLGSATPKAIKSVYQRLQSAPKEKISKDDRDAIKKLRTYYKPYNEELQERFNLDVRKWS